MKVLILCLQTTETRMEYTLQGQKIPSKRDRISTKQRSIVKDLYKNMWKHQKDSRFQLIEDIIVQYKDET
jgi:hypothetical protein